MAASEPNPALFAEYAPHDRRPPLGSSEGLEIRAAEPGDLPQIARLTAQRQGGSVEIHLAQHEKALRDAREIGKSLILVAARHGRIVGYAKAGWFEPPAGAPPNAAPAGWYLFGVIVDPDFRRRGVGSLLTRARLSWIAEWSPRAYYFASALNRASIDLHDRLGFVEVTRDFHFPQARFTGGVGILFEADLTRRG